jgi:choline dehydrogenase-like flavoprotein
MIEALLARGGDLVTRADVCVIGSGAGGAVAAAELAAAGRDVVVLEQGAHWTARDFTQREDEMLPRLFEEAGMRQTADGGITILQGRCVGGSTVHNLCYSFRTPPAILRMWREEHALPELTEDSLAESFARVEANLRVKPIREDEVNTLNRLLRAGAEKLGYSGFVTRHNRENCVRAGYCLLGCGYGAKQSMLVTYVPRASEHGARVYANARAERIQASASGPHRVLGSVVDEAGRSHGSIQVEAPVVVLAAGAVASPDLLLRSGLGGPDVGRHLHLHPSVMVAGYWPEPIHAYRGIPQSYYIDEFIDLERDPHTGYVLMPISGFPVLVAVNTPGFGREHFRQMRNFSKLGGLLVLLHDRSEGSVRSGDSLGKPEIRYALDAEDRAQLAEGMRHCAEVLFAAGAERVVAPFLLEPLTLTPGDDLGQLASREVREGAIPIASTHPQSTCRMGGDPARSVVNAFGELHGVRGVFVADMSVFPTSLGAPPQITTAALADRTAQHIIARGSELGG